MNIDIKDTLKLDDNNEYVVVSKVNYENKYYYYLIDMEDPENLMFCYEDNGDLVELMDKDLTAKLLPLFLEKSNEILSEFINNSENM
mgnify:CR=1 FL=1